MEIKKGKVTSIDAENKKARVESIINTGEVTRKITIPANITAGDLKKGSIVAYVVFEDMEGVILAII